METMDKKKGLFYEPINMSNSKSVNNSGRKNFVEQIDS